MAPTTPSSAPHQPTSPHALLPRPVPQALLLAPAGPGPTRRNELRALKAGPRCLLLPPSLPQLTGLTSLAVLARPSDPATEDIAHMQHSLINPAVEQPPALALPSLQGLELALSSVVLRAVLQGLAPDTLRGLSKLQLLAMDKQGGGVGGLLLLRLLAWRCSAPCCYGG